jgi:tetratricopeptide (TPR) repeat protein
MQGSKLGLLLGIAWLAVFFGCSPKKNVETTSVEDAKKKISEIASGGQSQAAPNSVFTHPIDLEPEGRKFRKAARALDMNDFETATKIAEELSQAHPQFRPLATAIQAILLVKQGKLDEGMKLAEELSTLQVMQPEAYVIAGEVFHRQNRLNEATGAFTSALQQNPQHVRAHMWLGAVYYDTGAMGLANKHLREAAELDPSEVNALMLSAKIHQDYEQYDEAVIDYRKVLERISSEDKKLPFRVKLAECLSELRKLDEALEVLKDCQEVPAVLACRATISEAKGEFEPAMKLARQALAINPENQTAGMVLGRISLTERNWELAKQTLQPLVKALPYDHESRLLLGRALVGAGETEAGQAEIKRATELKDAFLQFAKLHEEAIRLPKDAPLRIELGKLAETLGKQELAKTWYQAALGLDANNVEALEGMKRLEK